MCILCFDASTETKGHVFCFSQLVCLFVYVLFITGDLVTVENVLTECEAAWLTAFVECMHDYLPLDLPFYQERPFGSQDEDPDSFGLYKESGGNHVTYLAGLLQRYLPGVTHSLYTAVTMAYHYGHWHESAPGFAVRNHPHLLGEHHQKKKNDDDDDGKNESHNAAATKDN